MPFSDHCFLLPCLTGVPAVITLSVPPSGLLLDGLSPADACQKLEEGGAAVVGLNCGMGPATMLPVIKEVKKTCKVNSRRSIY